MKRTTVIVLAFGLIISACAAGESSSDADRGAGETAVAGDESDGIASDESSLPVNEGQEPKNDAATGGLSEPGDTPPPADDSDSLVLGEGVPGAVSFALADLAAMLGISEDLIDWVSHDEIDWPDASVGCPQPGMVYAQVITNGTLTVFEVDGIEYRYHAKAGMDPFYCDPAIVDPAAKGSIDQIDLRDYIVTPTTPESGAGSTPTESIPPPSGSDE